MLSCRERVEAPFSGMKWVMERISDRGVRPGKMTMEVFIAFDDTARVARGYAGCNAFWAAYSKQEGCLAFSNLEATKTTCPDMYAEAVFFRALEETNRFALRRGRLYLKRDDETLAVFRPGR
jgi:heat shock protein HslJ